MLCFVQLGNKNCGGKMKSLHVICMWGKGHLPKLHALGLKDVSPSVMSVVALCWCP